MGKMPISWGEIMKKPVVLLLCAWLFMTFSGCGEDEPSPPLSDPNALTQRGPYAVGVRETSVSYQPPGQTGARKIPVIVWYPTHETEGKKHTLKLAKAVPLPTNVLSKPPIAEEGPFPVVVHSHGSGGEAALAYPAAEIFASRGWVVVSISHKGNTTLDALGDPLDIPMYIPIYRMLDVRHTLDAAENGFEWEQEFNEQIDAENVFMYGHSLGGYTSMAIAGASFLRDGAKDMVCEGAGESCEDDDILCGAPNPEACAFLDHPEIVELTESTFRDPRVRAIGLQAPGAVGMIDPSTVETPALMMTGDQDAWLPLQREAQPIWQALHHPEDLWLRFDDAGHLSFITVCEENVIGAKMINNFMPAIGNDGCNEEYISPAHMADINTAYMIMFAEKHLLGVERWDAYLRGDKMLKLTRDVRMNAATHAP